MWSILCVFKCEECACVHVYVIDSKFARNITGYYLLAVVIGDTGW